MGVEGEAKFPLVRVRWPEPMLSSLLFGLPPPSPLPPELSEGGGAKKQHPLPIPITTQPAIFDLGFVKLTRFGNLFSVFNPHVGIKQLARGVRCAHIYLLSTLEDFVLSSLLLPQISLKNKPITNFGGCCAIPAPRRLSWCLTGFS